MADRGWNPKACFVGMGEDGNKIITKLKDKWKKLIKFHDDYKRQNPEDFYDNSGSPIFDFFLFDLKLINQKKIDASQYHFVFLVINKEKDTINTSINKIFKNESVISILLTNDRSHKQQFFKNGTIAILPNEGFHNKSSEFVIDVMRFCMFPRFVSFDFLDFKIIQRRTVNIAYLKTSREDYEIEFREFYRLNIRNQNSEKETIAIFYFQDCENVKDYYLRLESLRIPIYSDHCASPTTEKVKALLIS